MPDLLSPAEAWDEAEVIVDDWAEEKDLEEKRKWKAYRNY